MTAPCPNSCPLRPLWQPQIAADRALVRVRRALIANSRSSQIEGDSPSRRGRRRARTVFTACYRAGIGMVKGAAVAV